MSDEPGPPGGLPALERRATLRDGTVVTVRPIRPDDAARLERLFYRLSPETVYRRFFTLVAEPDPAVLRYLAEVDHDRRVALVAVLGDEIIGVARYDRVVRDHAGDEPDGGDERDGASDAEAALLTEDAWQGRGVATVLLGHLAEVARSQGLTAFVATVLGENRQVVRLLRGLSPDTQVEVVDGQYRVVAPLV